MKANWGHANSLGFGLFQDGLAGAERIGNRFFTPHMLARGNRLAIEIFMLLHVGHIDQQFKIRPGQHLIDMGILIGNIVILRLINGSLGNNVTRTHQFHIGAFGKFVANSYARRFRNR